MSNHPVMVISGTSKGIGRAIAEFFVGKGYHVEGCSRGPSTLQLEGYRHTQIDVGDEIQIRQWVRSIKKGCGRIDVLICNAGLALAAQLFTLTSGEAIESMLRTNVSGTYYLCREVARAMILQRSGRIITFSSMAVGLHEEGTSAYAASKSAVVEMTKILAKELAPMGITCNVLAPSMIKTESVEALGKEVIDRALEKLTIKRPITIEEICNVISFLTAPESGSITGQVIHMGLVT